MKLNSTGKTNSSPLFFYGIALAWLISFSDSASAQDPIPESGPPPIQTVQLPLDPPSATNSPPPESLGDILRTVLLQAIDEEYVDERNWGKTIRRFDGFHVRGTRISKRERDVNHGFWQRYRVRLVRPEETLKIDIQQDSLDSDGIQFTLGMSLRIRCDATYVLWNLGVKGINGTAVSDATVKLKLVLQTRPQFQFSLQSPLPKLELRPKITKLELKLKDLDLRRLGIFEGPGVELIGDGSRKAIEEVLQQQTGKLKIQLQKRIDESGSSR